MKVSLGTLREYFFERHALLVTEGRIEDAREKYPDMDDEDFNYIVANQPAGSNNKYLLWSLKQADALLENDPDRQALTLVIQAVRLFDGNKQRLDKKDLGQYADTAEVETAVDNLGNKKSKSQEAKQARADTETIYNDDRFLVVRPHTTEASCKYGIGTKWCIAATASRNYFNSYSTSNNKFYFVIDKKGIPNDPKSKFAFAIIDTSTTSGDKVQIYDASDKLVNVNVVAQVVGEKWPEIWKLIQSHVAAHPITREVEDARKATEEHVKALMQGEKVSKEGMIKIARDAPLTTKIVAALIKFMKEYSGESGHDDVARSITSGLTERASQLTPEGAAMLVKYIQSTKSASDSDYWYGEYRLRSLYQHAPLTPEFFEELVDSGDESVITYLISNPNTSPNLKAKIASKVDEYTNRDTKRAVYKQLIKDGNITAEQMKVAMEVGLASEILHYPELSSNMDPELLRLVPLKDRHDIKRFLQLPNVPHEYVAELLSNNWKTLRKPDLYEILKSVSLPLSSIEKIWANKDQHIRTSLLQNPSIGPENAKKFALSQNSAYRFAIAHNTITSPEDLEILSTDESVSTRAAVAANPKTPGTTLAKLARDEANAVRAGLAGNAAASPSILQTLSKDSDEFTRKIARKTLKTLQTAETYIRLISGMMGMMLNESMDDEPGEDIMNPAWHEISKGSISKDEFIAVFLLQNNGSATREEITDAYQNWMGRSVGKDLWAKDYSGQSVRGSFVQGKGWFWSPPGVNKGALFRLTPQGASAAMEVLKKNIHRTHRQTVTAFIESSQAKPGQTYYIPQGQNETLDITGFENCDITFEEVQLTHQGEIAKHGDGKVVKLAVNRSKRDRRWKRAAKVFKCTPRGGGEPTYKKSFPKVSLETNTPVVFVRVFYGTQVSSNSNTYGDANKAIVKYGERFLLTMFPLWAMQNGEEPARETNVAPPIKKSAPSPVKSASTATSEPAADATPRGAKTTYKIYGKFKGHPAATRLKGQAYVAGNDTQFRGGEQANVSPEDGKLRVKKTDSDHSQLWDPIDG